MTKKELLSVLDALPDTESRAKLVQYKTEDEFYEAAIRIANLTPGDMVYIDGEKPGIYLRPDYKTCGKIVVMVWDEEHEMTFVSSPVNCLTFERVAE